MSIQRLTTWGGDYHYNSSESEITNGNFYGFIAQEDTVVSVMTGGIIGNISSPPKNYRTTANIVGKTLKAGARITVPEGEIIKNFDLTSGSVILLRSY